MTSEVGTYPRRSIEDGRFVALKREFVFKLDGGRPILYPLDYVSTPVHFLEPIEGFALSLLNGDHRFGELRGLFQEFFPAAPKDAFDRLVWDVDDRVRAETSPTGLGAHGLFDVADDPIRTAYTSDPRDFVVDPDVHRERDGDVRRRLRLDTPINIYTVFTHRCRTNCVYCYAERRPVAEMPLGRWRELIAEMRGLGIQMCSPDNGDTFARRDGIDLLECLIENEMLFLLSTKAHISRDQVRRLISAGFTRRIRGAIQRQVQLSIDAVDDDVAGRVLRIANPGVAETAETFDGFLAEGIMPIVKAVVTSYNVAQPLRIVEAYYRRGARRFTFVRYRRSFHRHRDELFVNAEHAPILRDQFDRIRDAYPDIELNEDLTAGTLDSATLTPEQRSERWGRRLGCGGGWYALGIAPNGSAFLCEQMTLDPAFVVGDARVRSIREIWDGEELARFIYPARERFAGTPCAECEEFERCMWEKGRCYRDAFFAYGSVYDTPPLCPKNPRPGLRLS